MTMDLPAAVSENTPVVPRHDPQHDPQEVFSGPPLISTKQMQTNSWRPERG
jgi:hypothetical protein